MDGVTRGAVLMILYTGSVVCAGINESLVVSNVLPRNDDGWVGPVAIGFPVNFFGVNYSQLYVNNNGNVSFTGGLYDYTPWTLTGGSTPMIAPFFGDVDTRSSASAELTYGQTTAHGHEAFVANWWGVGYDGVGYYNTKANKLNEFQLIMEDRSDVGAGDFDIYFNYDKIQWETGDASGGANGLGGYSAVVGYTNGAGSYYQFAGSLVNGALLDGGPNSLVANSNIGVPGTYLIQVRNGSPIVTTVPVPGVLLLGGLGAGAVGWLRRRRMLA